MEIEHSNWRCDLIYWAIQTQLLDVLRRVASMCMASFCLLTCGFFTHSIPSHRIVIRQVHRSCTWKLFVIWSYGSEEEQFLCFFRNVRCTEILLKLWVPMAKLFNMQNKTWIPSFCICHQSGNKCRAFNWSKVIEHPMGIFAPNPLES